MFSNVCSYFQVFESHCKSAVNSCAMINEHDAIAGCENGSVFHFDIRNMMSPVSVMRMGNSSVNHVMRCSNGLLLARGLYIFTELKIFNLCPRFTGLEILTPPRTFCHILDLQTHCTDKFACSQRTLCTVQIDLCLFVPCFPAFFDLLISEERRKQGTKRHQSTVQMQAFLRKNLNRTIFYAFAEFSNVHNSERSSDTTR